MPMGLWFVIRRRRITCSPIQMAGAFSRTQIIFEDLLVELYVFALLQAAGPRTDLRVAQLLSLDS